MLLHNVLLLPSLNLSLFFSEMNEKLFQSLEKNIPSLSAVVEKILGKFILCKIINQFINQSNHLLQNVNVGGLP